MKTFFLLLFIAFFGQNVFAQTGCGDNTKVSRIVIYITLPEGAVYQDQIPVVLKGRTLFADHKGTYYFLELAQPEIITRNDIDYPKIKNYVPDRSDPVQFSMQTYDGHCSAAFSFRYIVMYSLSVNSEPAKEFLMNKENKYPPLMLKSLPNSQSIKIKSTLVPGYVYEYDYKIREHTGELNQTITESEDAVKQHILDCSENDWNDIGRALFKKTKIKATVTYTLTYCYPCE